MERGNERGRAEEGGVNTTDRRLLFTHKPHNYNQTNYQCRSPNEEISSSLLGNSDGNGSIKNLVAAKDGALTKSCIRRVVS